ncbi:MAG: hypothetical protein PHT19_11170 [Methylococcus sp.]|nr:hypothetical protein [Methylococcus sp.]
MRPTLDATYPTRSPRRLEVERYALMLWIARWIGIAAAVFAVSSMLALAVWANAVTGDLGCVP